VIVKSLVFLAQPCYGQIEPESYHAAQHAVVVDSPIDVHLARFQLSMTCKNCNDLLCECVNRGCYDYFAMLHADVAPDDGWLGTLIAELELHKYDVIHAPCAFKNATGITSTAIAYSDDIWAPVRRITTTELRSLPDTFDVVDLRALYDANAEHILLNTGCMVFRMADWVKTFPGFFMEDRIVKTPQGWRAQSMSEDYTFGVWCARNGIRVGVTKKVSTKHYGRANYWTAESWGPARDEEYYRDIALAKAGHMT
jgi:hypothetical protein